MAKKNLLVFTNGFPSDKDDRYNCQFVSSYTDQVKDNFDQIFVISPQPIFPKWLGQFPILKKFSRFANFNDYKKDNIQIFYPKFFTLPLSIFRQKNYRSFLKCAQKTIQSKKISFYCIHAHFISPTGRAALELKKDHNKKLILTPHGGDIYSWPYESPENFSEARSILAGADKITAASNVIYDNIKKISPEALGKTIKVPNSVDTSKFKIRNKQTCRAKLGLPPDKKILLNIANLTDGKGHLDLLKAFKDINKVADTVLYLIGTGELKEAILRQIKQLGLSDTVVLVGPIANKALPLWYGAADLFVFPSYFEGFGIVQIEAMACGLPVVAYANEGSKEIIKNKDLGLLVEIGNTKLFSRKIVQGLNKKWDSNLLRGYIVQEFSLQAVKDKLISLYQF